MSKRFEDIDNENLKVAEMIRQDSTKIENCAVDEEVVAQIRSYEKTKWNVYKVISAVAACAVLCMTIFAWKNINLQTGNHQKNNNIEKTMISLHSDKNVKLARNYSEIDKKIDEIIDREHQFFLAEGEMIKKSQGVSSSLEAVADTLKKEYSQTNKQTENVDEADIVKTDGKYIYTLSSRMDNQGKKIGDYDVCWIGSRYKLTITAVDGKRMEKVSSVYIESKEINVFGHLEMYISGDVLVLTGEYLKNKKESEMSTCIFVYDISDRKQIKLKDINVQDGSYSNSRLSDGYLYTISNYDFYNYKEKECVPKINGNKMDYECVYLPKKIENKWPEYTVITALDIHNSNDFTSEISILGGVNNIYVSQNNIYLLNVYCDTKDITNTQKGKQIIESQKDKKNYKIEKSCDYTKIMKYSYKDGKINYVAAANLPGWIDDQFSLDEKDGYLRMVTHINNITSTNLYRTYYDAKNKKKERELVETLDNEEIESWNNVYVLASNLEKVASIKGLAKNEEIYSVRFLGDYGYFVSFENTDPLFTIDFSDMKHPKVVGELKMPGFSDYLQFYRDDLLFGIGQNGDDKGNLSGLKLDMYDVEKGKAKLKSKLVLKEYDYSEAFYNYKSILIDSKKELIGFYAERNSDSYVTDYLLYTYKNNQFKKVFKFSIGKYVENLRGIYIGDYFYIVNPERKIYAVDLLNYKKVSEVKIR
ncbi:MAG: hypothetical protein HFG29_00335 [Eubacterium sp.]|nr:hypothetical protein [Eubacterium sp.]